jgi:tape measure domain-containing protein
VAASLTFDVLARDKASPTLDKVGKKVEGLSTKAVAFGSFLGNAMTGGVVALGKMGIAAAKMGISTAASLEQAQVGFTTLLGSGKKAEKFLADLSQFAASTPFELPGLIDSSRLLLGVGVAAQDVIPMLTAFGDAAGAVGVGQDAFQRIMLATSQAVSAGRFQVGDLNQIVTNGIPAWKLLSEATHKTVPQLRDMASKGKLLAKDVLPALQKQMEKDYGGAMARQSKTLVGVWSTLMDTLNIGLANVIKPLVPWLTDMIPKAAAVMGMALTGTAKAVGIFIDALSGRSELNEFDGVFKKINNAGIITAEVFGNLAKAIDVFFGAASGHSELNEFDGVFKDINNAGITAGEIFRTLGPLLVKTFKDTASAAATTVVFLAKNKAILYATVGVVASLVGVVKAYNVAIAVQSVGGVTQWLIKAAKGWTLVSSAVKVATAVQWAYNVALDANPIGLIIVGIVALVAAVVLLWRNNETFRRVTIKVWDDVKAAVMVAADWIATKAWPAIVDAWDSIVGAAMGLWHGVSAAWSGTVDAVRTGVSAVLAVGSAIADGFGAVGHVFAEFGRGVASALEPLGHGLMVIYRNFIKPFVDLTYIQLQIFSRVIEIVVKLGIIQFILLGRAVSGFASGMLTVFRAIGTAAMWLYTNAILPAVGGIMVALRAVGTAAIFVWQKALVPAWHGIAVAANAVGSVFVWLYRNAVLPAARGISAALQVMYKAVVKPVLEAFGFAMRKLGAGVSWVWTKVLQPTFDALRSFVRDKLGPAFTAGVEAIRRAWDGVKEAAKAPVRFVVETVINRGIIGTFNKVADYFGVGKVADVKLPKGFAKGGVFNEPTAIVGEGGPAPEYVIPTDRKHRKRALKLYSDLGAQLMASGGVLGWVTDPVGSLRSAVSPYLDQARSAAKSPFGAAVAGSATKLASGLGDYLKHLAGNVADLAGSAASSLGTGNRNNRSIGKLMAASFGWAGDQWTSLDALWMGESGWNQNAKNPTSTAFGIPQFLKTTAAAYGLPYGSTDVFAQISAGLKYIKDVYGNPSNAYSKWRGRSPHWYGAGGVINEPVMGIGLRSGDRYGFGERGPETVVPGRLQGNGGGGDVHIHLHNSGAIGSETQLLDWLARGVDKLNRHGRLPRGLRSA